MFGYDQGVIANVLVMRDFVERWLLQDVKNATSELDIFTHFPSVIGQTSMLLVPLPYASAP